jgi:hypothetical protein
MLWLELITEQSYEDRTNHTLSGQGQTDITSDAITQPAREARVGVNVWVGAAEKRAKMSWLSITRAPSDRARTPDSASCAAIGKRLKAAVRPLEI